MGLVMGVKAKSGGGALNCRLPAEWGKTKLTAEAHVTYFLRSHVQPLDQKAEQEETAFMVNEKLFPSHMTMESFQVVFNCVMVIGAT